MRTRTLVALGVTFIAGMATAITGIAILANGSIDHPPRVDRLAPLDHRRPIVIDPARSAHVGEALAWATRDDVDCHIGLVR